MYSSQGWRALAAPLRYAFACVLLLAAALAAPLPARAQQCTEGACVTAGPRLASVDTTQSALLNPLLQALLPGTAINLSVADWNALANADIDLNLLLTQLAADVGVSDPSQVLDTDIRLGQLMLAAATVLEADGQTAAANVLRLLGANVGGLAGTIRLAELLALDFPPGALADVRLGVLDFLTGWVQLYNFSNVVTTPQPITIDTAALGLPGITAVQLWVQVVEPPVYACGPTGSQFYSAAVRVKLNVTAVNTAVLDPIIDLLDGLSILGLVSLENVSLGAEALHLELYADIARAEGAIQSVDALASAVTLRARPGLVNLYLGTVPDALFWNRNTVVTPAIVDPVRLTDLGLTAEVRLLSIIGGGVLLASVTGDIGIDARAAAEGSPGFVSAVVNGPFPSTITLSSGAVSIGSLVTSLLGDLELEATGEGLVVDVLGILPIGINPGVIINAILAVVQPLLETVLLPVLDTLLDLVLGTILDTLLELLGIQIGQATYTVEGIPRACSAELLLAKLLDPVDDGGRFDLSIARAGSVLASATAVGHEGATSPVLTEPGASYTLAEAPASGTSLAAYATTWTCTDDAGTVLASGDGTSFELVAPGVAPEPVTVSCAFTNRLRQASLTVTKSDGSSVYVPGTTATYVIAVTNAGPDAAPGVTVSDALPAGVTLSGPWTCTASNGSCASASGGGAGESQVTVQLDLDADGQASISIPVQFSADPDDY